MNILTKIVKIFIPMEKCKNVDTYVKALSNKCGLEIGGPSSLLQRNNILPLYPHIKALDGCNFSDETIWEGKLKEGYNYSYNSSKPKGFQYILDAVDLVSIENYKYDFVISCHNLEHIANPIKALKEWLRVLKIDGYLLLAVPNRDGTFDHKRNITTLDHLIDDYNKSIGENDLSHLNEILALHDLSMDKAAGDFESFKKRSKNNFINRALHQHVFDRSLLIQLFNYLNIQIIALDLVKPFHIIIIGKKLSDGLFPDNSNYLCR
jgi:SAM-dependent methyltransferase